MLCRYLLRVRHRPVQKYTLHQYRPLLAPLQLRWRPLQQCSRISSATINNDVWQRRKDLTPTADTVYALSTAPGRAAIAVIRISGPACLDIYGGLCPGRPFPNPRTATLRKLHDPQLDETGAPRVLDHGALVLYFPAPNTVTGEDVLELHVHGGVAIVRSVLEAIPRCTESRPRHRNAEYSSIRHAEPGEFTKRAFYNGRLDLTQAEALGDTLAAETEQQRRLAVSGAETGLAKRYEEWRKMLLYARGELEALIDFSEDQYFDQSPHEFLMSVSDQILALKRQIDIHIKNASRGELLRNGISIALLGAPNAGKSSLLNRVVGREAAIVSCEEGTTRDIVDVAVDIGGWLCRFGDMAGLRSEPTVPSQVGMVEREGIRRARERALQSDVVILLLSVERDADGNVGVCINPEVFDAVEECQKAGKTVVVAINKTDLARSDEMFALTKHAQSTFPTIPAHRFCALSCKDADGPTSSATSADPGGIQSFLRIITMVFTDITTAETDENTAANLMTSQAPNQSYWTTSLSVTHRQSEYLKQCAVHLDDFLGQATQSPSCAAAAQSADNGLTSTHHTDNHDDLVGEVEVPHPTDGTVNNMEVDIVTAAEDLRFAASCLAKITGKGEGGDVEDVLGVVFEK